MKNFTLKTNLSLLKHICPFWAMEMHFDSRPPKGMKNRQPHRLNKIALQLQNTSWQNFYEDNWVCRGVQARSEAATESPDMVRFSYILIIIIIIIGKEAMLSGKLNQPSLKKKKKSNLETPWKKNKNQKLKIHLGKVMKVFFSARTGLENRPRLNRNPNPTRWQLEEINTLIRRTKWEQKRWFKQDLRKCRGGWWWP